MVKEYLFSKEDTKLSDDFMLHEAKCPDSDTVLVSEELVAKVELLRIAVPNCATVEISSGYRTPKYSVSVGGSAKDQHTQGNAWDLACFDADHNIIDGKLVSCVAQDLGFNGIGYMGNYVHVDVGNRHWFGDEQTGKNIPNDDFYTYFGIARAEQSKPDPTPEVVEQPIQESVPNVDVTYQVYADGKWLTDVINLYDFAGIQGSPIQGIRINTSIGSISYRVHTQEDGWLTEVIDRTDFAGVIGHNIDAIEIHLLGLDDYDVLYKVSPLGNSYYPEVKNTEDYAGSGKPIDRVQIYVAHK